MATGKKLNYTIGIGADVSAFRKELKTIVNELNNLGKDGTLIPEIQRAKLAARELATTLQKSTDWNTGKLSVSEFTNELDRSGKTLRDYYNQISKIGNAGDQAFLKVAQAVAEAETPLKRTNKVMSDLWVTMKNTVRWQVTTSALHGLMGSIEQAYGYSKDLDSSLNSIRIVTQKSAEDMREFAKQANEAAKALSTTTTDYTDASLIYYQQGLSDEQVLGRTNTTIQLANVANESAEIASEQLTAIWNNFYDGSKSLQYYADVMVALGASTASSSDEIAQGIQKFAAVANTVGLSYEYAAAALATLTANTREAPEVIGNSLKTLFARLQGLTLGETLDDGTDLNKYSKALKSVGVEILDVNDNLKGMDQLLDETAEKWSTLTKSEKTALAQTVAGVRQYNQFISLMDSWDSFQENLLTARGSEGALSEQAEIYYQSWKSARDRVRAAWEDIYNSLINPDVFIELDNSLVPILETVSNMVDAFGGLSGILPIVASLMTKVYGSQIAQTVQDIANNIGFIEAKDADRARSLREQSALLAKDIAMWKNTESDEGIDPAYAQTKAQISMTKLQNIAANYADQLNERQVKLLENDLDRAKNLQDQINLLSQQNSVIDEQIEKQEKVLKTGRKQIENLPVNIKQRKQIAGALGLDIKEVGTQARTKGKYSGGYVLSIDQQNKLYNDLLSSLKKVSIESAKYEQIQKSLKASNTEINDSTIQLVKSLGVELTDAYENTDNGIIGYLANSDGLEQSMENQKNKIKALSEAILIFDANSLKHGKNLQDLVSKYKQGYITNEELVQSLEVLGTVMEETSNGINKNTYGLKNWSEKAVEVVHVMSSIPIVLQGIQNIGNIFNREDLTDGEKLIQLMTSISMIAPSVVIGLKTLQTAINGASNSFIANAAATALSKIGSIGAGGAALIAGKGFAGASAAASGFTLTLGTAIPIIAAITAGVFALVKVLDFLIVTDKEVEEEQRKAKEAIDELNESIAEQEEKFKSLEGQLKSAKDRLDELLSQDTLTVIEEEEVAKLREEIALLERQYEIEKELRKINAEKKATEYIEKDKDTGIDEKLEKGPDLKTLMYQTGTYGDLVETKDLELWYQKQKQHLDKLYSGFENTDDYNQRLSQLNTEYNQYKQENKEIYQEWANSLSEDAERIQTQYNNLITWVNEGVLSREDYQDQIDSYIQQLSKINKARFQDQYAQIYIYPVVDNTALKKVQKEIYNLQDYSNMQDSDILEKLGLSSDEIKETIYYLDTMGISLKDIIATVQKDLDSAKDGIARIMGNYAEEFLNQVSGEDLSLLASLNWDINAKDSIDSIEDMFDAMGKLVIKTQDWTGSLNESKEAARSALDVLAAGDDLDEEAIINLQNLFTTVGTYDLSNLQYLSEFEQAVQIGEAYLSLENVGPMVDQLNDTISQNRATIKQLDKDLEDLGYDSTKTYEEMRRAANKVNDSNEEIGDSWELIEKKLLDRSALKTQVDAAITELDRIKDYKMDPIEIELAKVDTIIAEMKKVEKAASLIGEGFKVEVENVAELAKTLPELLLDAWVDEATGVVNLQQSVVEEVAKSTENMVSIQAEGLSDSIQNRIAATNEEIRLIQAIKNAAISGSSDAVAAVVTDAEEQRKVKQQVSFDIVKAAIQQAISERAQARGTADEATFYMQEATRISGIEGVNTAKNYAKAFQDIAQNAQKAFQKVAQFQKDPQSALAETGITITSGLNAAGMSSGTSQLGVYQGNAEGATREEQLVLDYLNTNGDIKGTLPEGMSVDSAAAEALIKENAKIIADTINDIFKIDLVENPYDVITKKWTDTFISDLGDKAPDAMEEAISMLLKDQGRDITALSEFFGAQGIADELRKSGLPKDKDKGSKDKTGKTYDEEDAKTLEDIEDRYHEITREILRQSDLLDDIGNDLDRAYGIDKLRKYQREQEALNKQLTNYNSKLKEATERYLPRDTQKLRDLFGAEMIDSRIKANGELKNYEDLLTYAQDQHQQFINDYNEQYIGRLNALSADKEAQEAWLQSIREDGLTQEQYWKQRKEAADEDYEARQAALKQYEDTRDTIQEVRDNIEDTMRAIADNRLSQIEYRLEIVLDVKSMKDAIREFDKKVTEIFNDALTHGLDVAKISKEQAEVEAAMYPEYADQYRKLIEEYESADNYVDRERIMKDIQDLQGKVLESAEAIVNWVNSIEDIIPDAVDAAATRFKLFTDQLEHNTTILDTIRELYALQGVTYKTMDGFNRLQKVSQEKLEAQVAESKLQKAWYEEASVKLQEAQAALDSLNGDEKDLRYDIYKKARDAYLQEFNEAQEAYLSLAQQAMETAQQMYLEQIERAVYEFGQAVSGGIGLDLLQDKYDHYIEKDERYFDKVNEAYQVTSWYNKLQADIDSTTNSKTKDRLKALQQEIDIRREGNKLSQYDLDILNAKYEVLKAQMALEDAQNAKNNYQLVRDRQGNWNYQFTADPEAIESAEQDLIDAQIDWYNIAKQQVTDVTGEIISTWQECQDKIKEIYSDMTLTDQERSDRAAEIYAYYADKIKYLEEEKQIAINDMTEAGNASLFANAVLMGDQLTDLTNLTSEDIKKIAEEGGQSMIDLLTKDGETIKNIIAGNAELIDIFDNVYAKDLDNMTKNTDKFEEELQKTLSEAEEDFRKYKDTVSNVAGETGTSLEKLDEETNKVSDSTDRLQEAGLEAASALWDMINQAQDLAFAYKDMAIEIWGAVDALKALAEEQANYVSSKADLENQDWGIREAVDDYSGKMLQVFDQYGAEALFGSTWDWLWADREVKYNTQGWAEKGAKTNAELRSLFEAAARGEQWALQELERVRKQGQYFDTGGYTGDFNDAKLAFLHEKELVLNKDDTKNILTAVSAVRDIGAGLFANLEKVLDGNILAALSLMSQKVNIPSIDSTLAQLEQYLTIEHVEFPNVTNSNEIEEAFANLANDASQYVRRRLD